MVQRGNCENNGCEGIIEHRWGSDIVFKEVEVSEPYRKQRTLAESRS